MLRAVATKHRPPVGTRTWSIKCGSWGAYNWAVCVCALVGVLSLRVRPSYYHAHCATERTNAGLGHERVGKGPTASQTAGLPTVPALNWLYHQHSWDLCAFLVSRTVMGLRFYRTSKYKWACHRFVDAGRRQEIPGSETKDLVIHGIVNSTIISILTSVFWSPSPVGWRQWPG